MAAAEEESLPPLWLGDLAERVPVGIVVIDATGKIAWCNHELLQQFRYTTNELLGQSMEILLPERLRSGHVGLRTDYVAAPVARAMGTGRDLFGRRQDGFEFPVEIGLRPLRTPAGTMFVATVADISARRQAEAVFHRVIEAAPCGMLMVDATRRILFVNGHLLRLFGYSRDELIGRSLDLLIPERHRKQHDVHVDTYARNASMRAMGPGLELTGLHKDGSEFSVEIGLNPVQMDAGPCTLATVIDITARKQAEQRLRRANTDLEEFAYVASHDLRSPLRGIADLVEWIGQDLGTDLPATVQHNMDRLRVRVVRMELLIEDLLSYAKAGVAATEAELVNVREWLEDEIELQGAAGNAVFHIDPALPKVRVLKTPLSTVLRNLISNAIKHNHTGNPVIDIGVYGEGASIVFTVRDNGPGIPAASRERVFKLFQRLSTTREGNGIGLALVKRIVEAHGGSIAIQDRDDEESGIEFKIRWPRNVRESGHG